jgi:hypothetical protein
LPQRQVRQDVIGEMRRRRHLRRVLHEGQTPRPWHEKAIRKVVPAGIAPSTGKTAGDDATIEVTTELPFDVGGYWVSVALALAGERKPRRQVRPHGAVQQGALRPAPPVRCVPLFAVVPPSRTMAAPGARCE